MYSYTEFMITSTKKFFNMINNLIFLKLVNKSTKNFYKHFKLFYFYNEKVSETFSAG